MRAARSLLILAFLAACAPTMKTEYELVVPPTKSGQQCAAACLNAVQNCRLECLTKNEQCEKRAEMNAQNDYSNYTMQQLATGGSVAGNATDFKRFYDFSCDLNACEDKCQQDLNSCHLGCGGKVIPHSTCTAFCK